MTDLYFSRNLKRTAELILSFDGATITVLPGSYGAGAEVFPSFDQNFGNFNIIRITGLPPNRQWHVIGTASGPTPQTPGFWTPPLVTDAGGDLGIVFLPVTNAPPTIPPRVFLNIQEVT